MPYGDFYSPCEEYLQNKPCEYKERIEITCHDCKKFDIFAGCLYGCSINDSRCFYEPIEKIFQDGLFESEYIHKPIFCPIFPEPQKCTGKWESPFGFRPCSDCPIDWSKVRLTKK